MTCRTCKWLIVRPNRVGKRVPNKDKSYTCGYQPERPKLPSSIVGHYSFKWPPDRSYMTPNDGSDCQTYEILEKK